MPDIVGMPLPPLDGLGRVAGTEAYTVDWAVPKMIYAKVCRSEQAHARILRIDTTRAEELAGVVGVLTPDRLNGVVARPRHGPVILDQPLLAIDRVRYAGEAVAAVAAVDPQIAAEAVRLIDVTYEALPVVADVEAAVKPQSPRVHEEPGSYETAGMPVSVDHNCCTAFKLRKGDVESAFADADVVVEGVYWSPPQQHSHLEPHSALARFNEDGTLEIWSATQSPLPVRDALAYMFGLPCSQVRVHVPAIGGGYGGKLRLKVEPIVCALAKLTGRPVFLALDREEVFATSTKHGCLVEMKTAARRDGTIVGVKASALYDTGAYADLGPITTKNAGCCIAGPYDIPHVHLDSRCIYTNKTPAGAFRGFGVTQVCWAYEQQVDQLASLLHMDAVSIRRKNLLDEGDRFATGERLHGIACRECLDAVVEEIGWQDPKPVAEGSVRVGRGVAVTIKTTMTPSLSSARVMMHQDGSVSVLTSSADIGQGVRTSLAQIAAHALDVPVEHVRVTRPDTAVTPYDDTTSSSRTTFSMGGAVFDACAKVKSRLIGAAAELLEARADDLQCEGAAVFVRGSPQRRVTYPRIIRSIHGRPIAELMADGSVATSAYLDPDTGQGVASAWWFTGACAVEIEVDVETGRLQVRKMIGAANCGRTINPLMASGQIEGSMVMALGMCLSEEIVFRQGQPLTSSFFDYKLPSMVDVPGVVKAVLVEKPHPDHPLGVVGIGETLVPAVAPAIGNALYDAAGIRLRDLPLTPERIVRAIHNTSG